MRTPNGIYGAAIRKVYVPATERIETQRTVGNRRFGFVDDATPAFKARYPLHGVVANVGGNYFNAGGQLRLLSASGVGAITVISQLYGAIELQTAAVLNDSIELVTGDVANPIYIYNVSKDIYFHARFQIPSVAQVLMRLGVYADVNNYVAIRLNTAVDGNLYAVTRSGGVEAGSVTSLGAADTNWHDIYIYAGSASTWFVLDNGNAVVHTANIPGSNLGLLVYVEALVAGVKTLRLQKEMNILQSII